MKLGERIELPVLQSMGLADLKIRYNRCIRQYLKAKENFEFAYGLEVKQELEEIKEELKRREEEKDSIKLGGLNQ